MPHDNFGESRASKQLHVRTPFGGALLTTTQKKDLLRAAEVQGRNNTGEGQASESRDIGLARWREKEMGKAGFPCEEPVQALLW